MRVRLLAWTLRPPSFSTVSFSHSEECGGAGRSPGSRRSAKLVALHLLHFPFQRCMGDATGTWLFAFSSAAQKSTHEVKGTLTNIRHTGEFVVNVVSHEMAEAMNRTSGE
jgi:hypothetical protein